MSDLSITIVQGKVGGDPELKKFESGKTTANFSLASNEVYKNSEGQEAKHTEWHKIVAWEGTAGFIERNIKKGMYITVKGKNRTRNYEKDGQTYYVTEVLAEEISVQTWPKESEE